MTTYEKFKNTRGNVLVIGDLHIPFEHPGYLGFCKKVARVYGCTRFVQIGDELDYHAASYHESDPNLSSAGDEFKRSLKRLKKWYRAFPEMLVCVGNHTAIPERKMKTAGLPGQFMKSYSDALEAPKGWQWGYDFVLDDVLYKHIPEGGGTLEGQARGAAMNMMSMVTGHTHTTVGVRYLAGKKNIVFACAVGCGIDHEALAFAYGKEHKHKPILACAVVEDGGRQAINVVFDLKTWEQQKGVINI